MTISSTRRIASSLALIAAAACGDTIGIGSSGAMAFARAQARWEREGPASYRVTISRSCFCLPEGAVVVTVTDGLVESRQYVSTGANVSEQFEHLFPSVDGLFDRIEEARRQRVGRLDVTYDPTYGHPVRIAIDEVARMVDDELVYSVWDFEPRP